MTAMPTAIYTLSLHDALPISRAQQYGLKLNEYELARPDHRIDCKEEVDIFRALDLDYIPPELREHTGEIEASAEHRSEEHTSELQSRQYLVCRLLLEKKKTST